jgi:hypothetical protein
MTLSIHGGCFCKAIRYSFTEPVTASLNCHCTMCRRTSAAPFVSWLVVPTEQFSYDTDEPTRFHSSDHGIRYFCDRCGTPVVCINDNHPEWVDVTIGSLDNPEQFPPTGDVYADTRLSWVQTFPSVAPDDS